MYALRTSIWGFDMNSAKTYEEFIAFLREYISLFFVEDILVLGDMSLIDIGLDSLDIVELAIDINLFFGEEIFDAKTTNVTEMFSDFAYRVYAQYTKAIKLPCVT